MLQGFPRRTAREHRASVQRPSDERGSTHRLRTGYAVATLGSVALSGLHELAVRPRRPPRRRADEAPRVAVLAIALASIVVHLSAGTTLSALAAGLSERSEGGGSGFQNAIETLRFAMSLVSGWAITSALASCIGVLGVVWVREPRECLERLSSPSRRLR